VRVKNDLLLFLIAFSVAFLSALVIIPLLRRLRAGQSILKYVDFHKVKSGTPTVGGLIFILPVIIISPFLLNTAMPLAVVIVLCGLAYGLLGFLDDFLKIKGRQNLGLLPYQKIVGQGGIAILVSYFFMTANPSGEIFIPFFNAVINIGEAGIFAFTFLVLVATTNAVNLTDGIDGLAGSVSLVYFVFVYIIISIIGSAEELAAICSIIAVTVGGLLAYLLFNTKKASVFMGDTGSLFLGAVIAAVSLFTGLGLCILVLGAAFVWSALSVVMQVVYFKATKGKRIFKMTPFHHHLEKCGFAEPKIVSVYVTVTVLMGVMLVLSLI
jgi:phospho-N-acetylmuramoyl-pentapeptide-transferase